MPKTVRFCISCGTEIGEALFCLNPECGGLPNFYRNVPGPDSTHRPEDYSRRPAHEPRVPNVPERDLATASVAAPPPDRRTLAFTAPPAALLRSVSPPAEEHLIAPGSSEVGARKPARIIIDRPEVSSRHARIECLEEGSGSFAFVIEDLNSTNGTFLNGRRIQREALHPGDKIRFGRAEFEFLQLAGDGPRLTLQV